MYLVIMDTELSNVTAAYL